jgi:diphthamide synthase (EF-2-diphthine--ammonia ligase)
MDRDEVVRVLRAFESVGLEYVLIGAAAMGIHGVVRATEDLDLFIRATADNVERLKSAFRQVYDNDPNIDEISADDLLGDYPAVRYYPPSGDLYFDVVTRLGEAASFESVDSMVKEIDGVEVCVATPEALYQLKRGTVRPLDHRDAEALRQKFGLEDD